MQVAEILSDITSLRVCVRDLHYSVNTPEIVLPPHLRTRRVAHQDATFIHTGAILIFYRAIMRGLLW